MAKFLVHYVVTDYTEDWVEVEADSDDEAVEIAWDDVCFLGNEVEITSVEEL